MKLRHVISTEQFLFEEVLDEIFRNAEEMERNGPEHAEDLKGKLVATLFYEPSTRTRISFDSAIQRLGAKPLPTESASHFSSVAKGETLEDTIRVIGGYCDAIVLRHSEVGSAKRAAEVSRVPIINAGDGTGEHPTQALLDIYTIKKELGRTENLAVCMMGDLINGRTVHSLVNLLGVYRGMKAYLASPPQLRIPEKYLDYLREKGVGHCELADAREVLEDLDVLYVTRIQKERFFSEVEYLAVKGSYVVDPTWTARMKENSIVMHPLPRIDEIAKEVDADPRAAYFRQSENGLYVRMALLKIILGDQMTEGPVK